MFGHNSTVLRTSSYMPPATSVPSEHHQFVDVGGCFYRVPFFFAVVCSLCQPLFPFDLYLGMRYRWIIRNEATSLSQKERNKKCSFIAFVRTRIGVVATVCSGAQSKFYTFGNVYLLRIGRVYHFSEEEVVMCVCHQFGVASVYHHWTHTINWCRW